MTKKETLQIIAAVVSAYPAHDRFKDERQIEGMVNVWYEFFKDDDYTLVGMAVRKHISINKWPPSIAEIREAMTDIIHPEILPPDAAWATVSDVISGASDYAYINLSKTFPPLIARVVETIGWHRLKELNNSGGRTDADRLAFMDLYKPAYERERQSAMLPQSLNAAIANIAKQCGTETYAMIDNAHTYRIEHEDIWLHDTYKRLGIIKPSEKKPLPSKSK